MVSLSQIQYSNSLISANLPSRLVAVFVGATSGIGAVTLKTFAKYTLQPRIYIIGRSQESADRIISDCQTLNPSGQYIFMKADISLIRNVDKVCQQIKEKEENINLLFLSQGAAVFDRSETSEGLHLLAALNYYTRIRFITALLPLLSHSPHLRRVISVGGGTQEGPIDATDFPALHVPLPALRGHLSTLITLGLEAVSRTAPGVRFVHDYPGTVKTPLLNHMSEEQMGKLTFVPLDESGERHCYLATTAMFPAKEGSADGVQLGEADEAAVAVGVDGERGSGMYSVGKECEGAGDEARELLASLREQGMLEKIWIYTQEEFKRITETGEGICK